MSDFSDFTAQIADWENRQDWSTEVVTSFVRMAEEKFNQELRVDRMIKEAAGAFLNRCADVPDDWLMMDFVQIENPSGANGYLPIRYKARDEFFSLTDKNAVNHYTIEGRKIFFGGTPVAVTGTGYIISYYGEVPVFSDNTPSWLYTKYPSMFLNCARLFAKRRAVGEEDASDNLRALVEKQIQNLNVAHLGAKASGSRLTRSRIRSFG